MIYKSHWQKTVEKNQKWHDWYAWYPVTIKGRKKVWLQTIERKWTFIPRMIGHVTEYRLKK